MLLRATATSIPLADDSVQTCVTSPPYWGLRSYSGEQSFVWGGDPEHAHDFALRHVAKESHYTGRKRWQHLAAEAQENGAKVRDVIPEAWGHPEVEQGASCGCGAWYGELGLEPALELYVEHMVEIMREVWRVLRPDGTLWLNLGDCYHSGDRGDYRLDEHRWEKSELQAKRADRGGSGIPLAPNRLPQLGLKDKDRVMMPARVALALQADGWWLRQEIPWSKPNPMPESVADRPTTSHEMIYLLAKSARYYYDADAVREPHTEIRATKAGNGYFRGQEAAALRPRGRGGPEHHFHANGRNLRSVWTIPTAPFSDWAESVRQIPVSWDEHDGDTKRKASPTCPVHASQDHQDSSVPGGVRAGGDRSRSADNDGRHEQALASGYGPTDQLHEQSSQVASSDSPHRERAQPATDRSRRSRRTDRAPETSPPYTPSARTAPRTERNAESHENGERYDRTRASRSAEDDASDGRESDPLAQTPPHTVRTSCTCSYYREVKSSVSHFATFPPRLPERCILAGSAPDDLVLDPFCGSGTTGMVAVGLGRRFVGLDLSDEYLEMARRRIAEQRWTPSDPFGAAEARAQVAGERGEEHQTVMELA